MNVLVPRRWILAGPATRRSRLILLLAAAILVGLALFSIAAPHAAAQGCAMCYQNAASSGAQGRIALRHGILILLVPALSLFAGIFILFGRRNAG
jgi:hypothetical protein